MKKIIIDCEELLEIIQNLADEVIKTFKDNYKEICIIGIKNRGDIIAKRIMNILKTKANFELKFGAIDITLYRDDLSTVGPKPLVGTTEIDFPLDGKVLLLVDDVLYTGRTIRAAIDEIIDFGRPKKVFLLVLVDRGGRELPICPDFVGRKINCSENENISVFLKEFDGEEGVYLLTREGK